MSKNSLLSYGTTADVKHEVGNRHIVCISGGVASAYTALWVSKNVQGEIIYYFNDTKWEHPDLYRFLKDLEKALKIKITRDTDGRTPEQVFYDQHMLGSNRAPICSRILKAERLQNFVKKYDTIYFGIDITEVHRAARITPIYERLECSCRFPLFDELVQRKEMFSKIAELGIEIPQMYKDGFKHNNCSGGCVRAGKKQWVSLYNTYSEIYADRERVETEFSKQFGGDYHFMKEMSLRELREAIEQQIELDFEPEEWAGECVGICGRMY